MKWLQKITSQTVILSDEACFIVLPRHDFGQLNRCIFALNPALVQL